MRDRDDLYNSFNNDANYLYQTHDQEFNLGKTSFECGRRNNSLKFWAMWKAIGTNGIARIVESEFKLADAARDYIKKNSNYKLYSFEESLSVCFTYKDFDSEDLCAKLYEKNTLMVGFGNFKDVSFIRLVVVNCENSVDDLMHFFTTLENFAKKNKKSHKKNIIFQFMKNDFIITIAWPEGMTASAGAWYDKILSNKGKYRVGHAAIVLIDSETKKSYYFDFGRYHTPLGFGRVRDVETDPDLAIVDADIQNGDLVNIEPILSHLSAIKSTHGKGKMYAALITGINFKKAFLAAKKIQNKGLLPYGPFVKKGTNCSRFVSSIIQSAGVSFIKK